MAADQISSTEEINVVLDGPTGTGKSVLCHRLQTGHFKIMPSTIGAARTMKHFTVSGRYFKVDIWDTNGLLRTLKTLNDLYYRQANVVVEFFAISQPASLEEVLNERIPYFRKEYPDTPILLVGVRGDLRQCNLEQPLFPMACGQVLAHLVGAVNYVECSAMLGQGVQEVFQEAIRATFRNSSSEITNGDLERLLISKIPKENEWLSMVMEYKLDSVDRNSGPELHSLERNQLEVLDNHLFDVASNSEFCSFEDICFCRTQEIDMIHLRNRHFGVEDITDKYAIANCTWWCIDNLKHQTCDNISDLTKDLICKKSNTSMRFVKQDCTSIIQFFVSCAPMTISSLVIVSCFGTLSFSWLSTLLGLEHLVIVDTEAELTCLQFPKKIAHSLKHLVLKKCDTKAVEVPAVLGELGNLQALDVSCNNFTRLPDTLGSLSKLQTLLIDKDKMVFPPSSVVRRSVTAEILLYLKESQGEKAENQETKIMVVGQEGVGKSTLIKSLKKSAFSRWLKKTNPPPKTDGVEISTLQLKRTNFKIYDLAGDVDYLNTHSLFLSPNSLHLVVFNLSQFAALGKDIRSIDQFCKLELWLHTIACQDVHSCAIIVGTHADHQMLRLDVLERIRASLGKIFVGYREQHIESFKGSYVKCLLCNPDNPSNDNNPVSTRLPLDASVVSPEYYDFPTCIPHILGYCEVSGTTNKNIKNLVEKVQTSAVDLKKYAFTETIPQKWLSFRKSVMRKLTEAEDLQKQPILQLSDVYDYAYEEGITSQASTIAMLRFFHSQGDFLWYEDIPEIKDVVILDPQWLSDQLRTLISHRSTVDVICDGVLNRDSDLPQLWSDMDEKNRSRLIDLFRSVGLCFRISEKEELFPGKLPVGWPDREMWPPLPHESEYQTSLLFLFSFVPPSLFSHLIVAINKKRESFAAKVQPLYYRFNVVYITKERGVCEFHQKKFLERSIESDGNDEHQGPSFHRIHLELMPYKNALKVSIRGPSPCCMVPNIKSTIEDVKSSRYQGIKCKVQMVCPECEIRKVQDPSTFVIGDSHDGFCPKGHNVGTSQDILAGKLSSSVVVPSVVGQSGRIVGETLEDHLCPKLFAVLPINLKGLSLKDRFVFSYIRDGYAVHLLCECPDGWHFVAFPGFRVGKPKEFF